MNQSTILSVLTPLIGLRLMAIGRAADLLWLQFGELREVPSRLGGVRLAGEWALHLQCPWQLLQQSAVLFGYEDLWKEIDGEEDVVGFFTRCSNAFNDRLKASIHRVDAVDVNEFGGFSLRVSGDIDLEVLPDNGTDDEQWRILQPGNDSSHFVFPENLRHP